MMMTNLFSIFDPSLSVFSCSLYSFFFVFLLFPMVYWPSTIFTLSFRMLGYFFYLEVSSIFKYLVKGCFVFISSIFVFIFFMNYLSLYAYFFCLTSHICVTLPLSFVFWFSIIFFIIFNSVNWFLSHLIPEGTPGWLMSFMVLVELVSNLIRPIALTFRLTANMMAGHLLLSLLGNFMLSFLNFSFSMMGGILQLFLVFMEMGVSLIQAYVFSVLLILYMSEMEFKST